MSLEGLLVRPENVRDLADIKPEIEKHPVWEIVRIPRNSYFELESIDLIAFPEIHSDYREEYLSTLTEEQISYYHTAMHYSSITRIINGGLLDDLKNDELLRESEKTIERFSRSPFNTKRLTELNKLSLIKINFPSLDLTSLALRVASEDPNLIGNLLKSQFTDLKQASSLLLLITQIKFIWPELLENMDIVGSPFYKQTEAVVRSFFRDGYLGIYPIDFAGCLRILAAERIERADSGFKLVMPEVTVESPVFPLPETRRFA